MVVHELYIQTKKLVFIICLISAGAIYGSMPPLYMGNSLI
uniref:Uncharacterized protein n=1 Tax=Arundo donax TaxID=35708 RepID=A0A0A9AWH9_ARUDO